MRPETLYRGMRLDYNQLKNYSFARDITLPPEFIYRDGMKCVMDGNEYGIYMSDNERMVDKSYAEVTEHDVDEIDHNIRIGMYKVRVGLPKIGIKMEIATDGLNIKEPYICQQMQGVYNNGFQGKEWISTEDIPLNNISYTKVCMGPDILHEEKDFTGTPLSRMKDSLTKEMEVRNKRLQTLVSELRNVPPNALARADTENLSKDLRLMYGERDAIHQDTRTMSLETKDDLRAFLLAGSYQRDGLDLESIWKIDRFMQNVKDGPIVMSEVRDMAEQKVERGMDTEIWTDVIKRIDENVNVIQQTEDFSAGVVKISDINIRLER